MSNNGVPIIGKRIQIPPMPLDEECKHAADEGLPPELLMHVQTLRFTHLQLQLLARLAENSDKAIRFLAQLAGDSARADDQQPPSNG